MTMASLVKSVLGADPPVAVQAYDGTRLGPRDAPATIVVHRRDALRRIVTGRGQLGIARAYVAGDIDIEGDIFAALQLLRDRMPEVKLSSAQKLHAARLLGLGVLRPLRLPPEEARLSGRLYSRNRSANALAHHYDIPDEFFALFLGSTMAYTCAVFEDEADSLDQAQANKYELVCRKLDLRPGMRLLDVGCGWGGMLLHSAERHGVRAVGVSLSLLQVEWARKQAARAGVSDRVEVRQQDYRDIDDGPYDAISTMGVFEHVGLHGGNEFFTTLHRLLRPGGRLLNHAVSHPPFRNGPPDPNGFIQRYVFPDSELQEVGRTVSAIQEAGFEVRHLESLREHYALTLRHWVKNLEENWDSAIAVVGTGRARVWRLYMAAFGVNFVANDTQIHQVLAVRPDASGASGMALRATY